MSATASWKEHIESAGNSMAVQWLVKQHGSEVALATAWQCSSFGISMVMPQLWHQLGDVEASATAWQ